MASLNTMVKAVSGMLDTHDLSDWENGFVRSVVDGTKQGDDTRSLTEKQIEVLTRIYEKHFAG